MPILKTVCAMPIMSLSLESADPNKSTTKLLPLSAIGLYSKKLIYGDEATMGFKDSLRVAWGDTDPLTWDSLQADWQWDWHLSTFELVITSPKGVDRRYAPTWSDLLVSVDVLESHQFRYILDPEGSVGSIFPITQKDFTENGIPSIYTSWVLWDSDSTYTPHIQKHLLDGQYLDWELPWVFADFENVHIYKQEEENLINQYGSLLISGLLPTNLTSSNSPVSLTRDTPIREGIVSRLHLLLWGVLLTKSLFLNDDKGAKPCYEPWMLWQMWKWVQEYLLPDIGNRIFDLSPNWGDT